MQTLEDASLKFLIILLQDKSTLKKVPRWLRGYLRTNVYIEKDDPLFFRKLVMGMPLDEVLEQSSSDALPTADDATHRADDTNITDADVEAYINRSFSTTSQRSDPYVDANNCNEPLLAPEETV